MGSLNDYDWQRSWQDGSVPRPHAFMRRLIFQGIAAIALFFVVVSLVNTPGLFGDYARYAAGEGLNIETSWLEFKGAVPALSPATDIAPVHFVIPAGGAAVKNIGVNGASGITFQGENGQKVKASAAGEIKSAVCEDGLWRVEIKHGGDFVTVYEGMSECNVAAGQGIKQGDMIGKTANGKIIFHLFLNDEELNPLDRLFSDSV